MYEFMSQNIAYFWSKWSSHSNIIISQIFQSKAQQSQNEAALRKMVVLKYW